MKIDTICVQGGYQPQCGQPRQVPIYQTTTFKYDTTEHMADLFDLKASGYFYTRLANPTNDEVAKKIAAMEGGVELGFRLEEAARIVEHTVHGAAGLLLQSGLHPEAAIDKVTTAGGITIRGLNAMERSGFTAAVIDGLKASR